MTKGGGGGIVTGGNENVAGGAIKPEEEEEEELKREKVEERYQGRREEQGPTATGLKLRRIFKSCPCKVLLCHFESIALFMPCQLPGSHVPAGENCVRGA